MQKLLEKYPYAMDVVREWFTAEMLKSLEKDDVPDAFKEMMREQGVPADNVAELVAMNPRALFDMLDEQSLYVQITGDDANGWDWRIKSTEEDDDRLLNPLLKAASFTRKECETKAVEHALSILNNKLNPVISETPNQTS